MPYHGTPRRTPICVEWRVLRPKPRGDNFHVGLGLCQSHPRLEPRDCGQVSSLALALPIDVRQHPNVGFHFGEAEARWQHPHYRPRTSTNYEFLADDVPIGPVPSAPKAVAAERPVVTVAHILFGKQITTHRRLTTQ